ncbi:hypothetical protein Hanom_Chr09g00841021 [Helianthus anomalus]
MLSRNKALFSRNKHASELVKLGWLYIINDFPTWQLDLSTPMTYRNQEIETKY